VLQSRAIEISEIRQMIEGERSQREALESYILQLKTELYQIAEPKAPIQQEEEEEEEEDDDVNNVSELSALRRQLELEQQEREKLKEITEILLKERNSTVVRKPRNSALRASTAKGQEEEQEEDGSPYVVPQWVKELDMKARKRTFKNKVRGETLAFKDKVKLFDSQDKKPVIPEGPGNPKSEHAVRARETAFGRVALESNEEIAKEYD
jgi:hypothetical protein